VRPAAASFSLATRSISAPRELRNSVRRTWPGAGEESSSSTTPNGEVPLAGPGYLCRHRRRVQPCWLLRRPRVPPGSSRRRWRWPPEWRRKCRGGAARAARRLAPASSSPTGSSCSFERVPDFTCAVPRGNSQSRAWQSGPHRRDGDRARPRDWKFWVKLRIGSRYSTIRMATSGEDVIVTAVEG
jgi:hypothetical protein